MLPQRPNYDVRVQARWLAYLDQQLPEEPADDLARRLGMFCLAAADETRASPEQFEAALSARCRSYLAHERWLRADRGK